MAVTEHGKVVLYRHFEEDMGEEKAKTLMDHLLPVGWTDLATKHEVKALELATTAELKATAQRLEQKIELVKQELKLEIAGVRTELVELRADLQHEFQVQMLGLVGVMVGLQGVLIAALKLL